MKIDIDIDSHELVEEVAKRVVATLKPLLKDVGTHGGNNLLNVQTLADYLQVTPQWIYQRVREKAIPHIKVGKFPRFKKRDIDLWLEELKVPAVSRCKFPGNPRGGSRGP